MRQRPTLTHQQWVGKISAAVSEKEEGAAEKRLAHGKRVLNKDFLRRYRAAYRRRRAGDATAVFPLGTYMLRLQGLVCCEAAPARE